MNNAASAVAEIRTPQFWSKFPLPHNKRKTFNALECLAIAHFVQHFVASSKWVCCMPSKIQEGVTPACEYSSDLDELLPPGFALWVPETRTMIFDGPLCVTSLVRLALTRQPSETELSPTRLEDRQIVIY